MSRSAQSSTHDANTGPVLSAQPSSSPCRPNSLGRSPCLRVFGPGCQHHDAPLTVMPTQCPRHAAPRVTHLGPMAPTSGSDAGGWTRVLFFMENFSPFDRILTNSVGKPRLEIEFVANPCCARLDSKTPINRTLVVLDFKIFEPKP
jgi:hypothetical protein